jgi:hypothetical protein
MLQNFISRNDEMFIRLYEFSRKHSLFAIKTDPLKQRLNLIYCSGTVLEI